MERVAPSGDVYQAGTFSGNPLSLTAGYATVKYLEENNVLESVNRRTENLVSGIKDVIEDKKAECEVGSIASMFCIYFGRTPRNYAEALQLSKERFMEFFWKMLENGVFLLHRSTKHAL